MNRDGGVECTVTSDSKTVKAAGHRVTQDQRAHNGGSAGPNLRVGSYGAERGSSRDGRNRISGLGFGVFAAGNVTVPCIASCPTWWPWPSPSIRLSWSPFCTRSCVSPVR